MESRASVEWRRQTAIAGLFSFTATRENGQFIFLDPSKNDSAIDDLPLRPPVNSYKGLFSHTTNDKHLFFAEIKCCFNSAQLWQILAQNSYWFLVPLGLEKIH